MTSYCEGHALLDGPRSVLDPRSSDFPPSLATIPEPPQELFVIGDVGALQEGLAVVGARKATPYGKGCARRFATRAAQRGIVIISGGAYGCDAEAHRAALAAGMPTVVFLGGGCDRLYPPQHSRLFQEVIDGGGAVVSEHPWDFLPLPYTFRKRNRLIAGLAKATLIVEAGLPSGTFSTADEALAANREVLVVPGAITAPSSAGANRLLCQGATPIVDDESFDAALSLLYGASAAPAAVQLRIGEEASESTVEVWLERTLRTQPVALDELYATALARKPEGDVWGWLLLQLAEAERIGIASRYPDGRWGPAV